MVGVELRGQGGEFCLEEISGVGLGLRSRSCWRVLVTVLHKGKECEVDRMRDPFFVFYEFVMLCVFGESGLILVKRSCLIKKSIIS